MMNRPDESAGSGLRHPDAACAADRRAPAAMVVLMRRTRWTGTEPRLRLIRGLLDISRRFVWCGTQSSLSAGGFGRDTERSRVRWCGGHPDRCSVRMLGSCDRPPRKAVAAIMRAEGMSLMTGSGAATGHHLGGRAAVAQVAGQSARAGLLRERDRGAFDQATSG